MGGDPPLSRLCRRKKDVKKKNEKKSADQEYVQQASVMRKLTKIDTLGSNLMVPGPNVPHPTQNIGKINFQWGVRPPIEIEKWLKINLPDGLHP